MNGKNDVVRVHAVCRKRAVREPPDVLTDLDSAEVSRLVKLFVEQGDGAHTVLALLEQLDCLPVGELRHLEIEHAGHDLEVVLHAMVDLLEQDLLLFQRRAKFGLDELSFRNVSNDADDQGAPLGRERAETDLDGELAAILAASGELSAFPHRAGARFAKIVVAVANVLRSEALGNQSFDLHALQLLSGVPEQTLGELVDDDDAA